MISQHFLGNSSLHLLINPCIPHALIQPPFARRDNCTLLSQPRKRNVPLVLVAAAHPIRNDVDSVPRGQQIQRRLRDAYVAFNADDCYLMDLLVGGRKNIAQIGDHHAERGLVDDVGQRGIRGGDFRYEGAEARGVLGGGVDGYREYFRGADELLGGGDAVFGSQVVSGEAVPVEG